MTSANVVYAILSTLKDVDSPAPAGVVYAALNSKGISLTTYHGIIDGLLKAKLIKISNLQLTLTEMGKELVSRVDANLEKVKAD